MDLRDVDPADCTDAQLQLDVPAQRECRCGATDAHQCTYWTLWSDAPPLTRRPRECLRRIDPSTAAIPF